MTGLRIRNTDIEIRFFFIRSLSLCVIATSSSPLFFNASAWLAGWRRWRKLARIQRFQIELEAQRVRIGIGEFDENGRKASIGTGLESLPKRIAQSPAAFPARP